MDPINREIDLIGSDKTKTIIAKKKFIEEMRNGLGVEIKKNAGTIKVRKVSFFKRMFKGLMDIF